MARHQSPLVGYNTNVRHRGKLYHIQTEDSGVNHPHVITHLFADGGRIIASRKTSYAEHVGAEDLAGIVRKLMQEQHKAIFIELRDCVYDDDVPTEGKESVEPPPEAVEARRPPPPPTATAAKDGRRPPPPPVKVREPELDVEALERAAAKKAASSAAARASHKGAGRYQQTVAAHPEAEKRPTSVRPGESIFGGQILQGKSLDEVILSYLADDLGEAER